MLQGHTYRGRYPRTFRRGRPLRRCATCGRTPATQWVGRLQAWLCATCQAVDRIRFLRRLAAAGWSPFVVEWAGWELDRIVAAFEVRRP